MSTRSERAANSSQNELHNKVLKALMQRADNRKCADCRKNDPRWASWNLGIFMCIRCSGVHRSLGTHISKVKSADLDTWTLEQVQNMVRWGNAKANLYWESSLPPGSEIPEAKIEQWIRSKYDKKQFAAPGPIPEPETLALPQGITEVKLPAPFSTFTSAPTPAAASSNAAPKVDLDPFAGMTTAAPAPAVAVADIMSLYSQPPKAVATPVANLVATASNPSLNQPVSNTSGIPDFAGFYQQKQPTNSSNDNDGWGDFQ